MPASCCRRRRAPSPSAPKAPGAGPRPCRMRRRPRPARSSSAPHGAAAAARSMPRTWRWSGRAGRARPRRPPPPPPVEAGAGWSLVPDGRFLWQGPQAARGAYVWAHGRAAGGQDSRGSQPQPHVRVFNNAGYDVLRFDRDPADRRDRHRGRLAAARAADAAGAGLCAGSSSAASRAAPGTRCRRWTRRAWWMAWWRWRRRRMARPAARPGPGRSTICGRWCARRAARSARVVVANFASDEFDPDPDRRATLFRSLGAPRIGALLFLDRPAGGHRAWRRRRCALHPALRHLPAGVHRGPRGGLRLRRPAAGLVQPGRQDAPFLRLDAG